MTPIEKLEGIYTAARALQMACASDVIEGAGKQILAHQSFVDSLATNLEAYLGPQPDIGIIHGVIKLGRI